jgi:hypothetical protein
MIFTREYTKCTAGSTFCFVVVVLGKPLIKLASISADMTVDQTLSNIIRHDQKLVQTRSDTIRLDQTQLDTLIKLGSISPDSSIFTHE